jgi:ribosomal protein S18 acetylase RimI-like enzyme
LLHNAVAASLQLEFLDLRHFRAHDLRTLLDEESALWRERLHWDYRGSANLLLQYVDSHLLIGYVAIDQGKVCGYTFCVQEQAKAIVGDVFASRLHATVPAAVVEKKLLDHLLETLRATPGMERIEAQLLLHPHGAHQASFAHAGFQAFKRLYLVTSLDNVASEPPSERLLQNGTLLLRHWQDGDFEAAAHNITQAYAGHIDSTINDQYCSVAGASRFLHNIVRFPGCGQFSAPASWVVLEEKTGAMQALLLASRISPEAGHITQVCVAPHLRLHGLGRLLLETGAQSLRSLGCSQATLTVTESNQAAIGLYTTMGYHSRHTFDAMLWMA